MNMRSGVDMTPLDKRGGNGRHDYVCVEGGAKSLER